MKEARVAVVDDSTFIRKALARMLGDHPNIHVVGTAGSGEELLNRLVDWDPDVVTLDLDMPGMGGLATLDRLMMIRPMPVIILSTHSGEGAPLTIEALHRGATDFIDKQRYSLVDFEALRAVLLEKIFQVTGVAVEGGDGTEAAAPSQAAQQAGKPPAVAPPLSSSSAFDLVVIGASTGGPPTIQKILEDLGGQVPVPIVIVQHMPIGFTQAFAERLNAHLPLPVTEAKPMERLLPGSVYIAPSGVHLRVRVVDGGLVSELSHYPEQGAHRPSIDVLFASAAEVVGARSIGVLLTGMGRDGAEGLAKIKARGGMTLAQDEETCIVYGMPRVAVSLDAVTEVAALPELGGRLQDLITS